RLHERARLPHRLEFGLAAEIIVHTVMLVGTLCAGGDADRQQQRRLDRQQGTRDRGLAGARGCRNDEAEAAAGDAHSMFCTCSRNCSIAAFNFSPVAVSATEADLLHSVLASRLNSCT